MLLSNIFIPSPALSQSIRNCTFTSIRYQTMESRVFTFAVILTSFALFHKSVSKDLDQQTPLQSSNCVHHCSSTHNESAISWRIVNVVVSCIDSECKATKRCHPTMNITVIPDHDYSPGSIKLIMVTVDKHGLHKIEEDTVQQLENGKEATIEFPSGYVSSVASGEFNMTVYANVKHNQVQKLCQFGTFYPKA